jgi:hypothetical protein
MTGEALGWERWWMIAAGVCMIVAATALLWRWNVEVAFVSATLGIVCWFLNMRNRLKKSIVTEVAEDEDFGEEDESE